ncbi:type I polyketide synthase [Streptomyces sp. TBY4]|uniref:type I polyketide synthase n=1 Tax=Streptomyces sp. TBY4 TaxID=2962030 RepID=UPI0020B804E9|nr:type I polyketide synthase [Streptomyces sp. TBY4]MCP3760505.1 SDR family NAD(P)-dependent oxidoreductase [Streptomyces sp. TBY4]
MADEHRLRDYLKRATVELADTRRQLADLTERHDEPVAVIGMSCRYPGAESVDAYWELLSEGRTAVTDEVPADRFDLDPYDDYGLYTRSGAFLSDIAGWDSALFGHSPQEALRMDPHQRMLMELVWEAMENAGTPPSTLAGSRTGVMVGFSDTLQYGRLQAESQGPRAYTDPYMGQGSAASVVAGRLAYHFDLRGPAMTLDTACSSSLVAVHQAVGALRRRECDLAVAAGGFLMMQPDVYIYGCATSMLSPDGLCRTFDERANGYVMGEGGGAVILARLSDAVRQGHRIRAVIRGSAVNQDGRSNGLTAPSRGAQVDVIRRSLAAAKTAPDEVAYVEAHGSATALGDAIELGALNEVFGGRDPERPLHVGAVKTNIGHTQAAAGMAGLIKTVLVLENGVVPPNLHMEQPAAAIPEEGTVRPAGRRSDLAAGTGARVAGVSAFGWSGTNAHVVLEAAPPATGTDGAEDVADAPAVPRLLPVSAAADETLRTQLGRLADAVAGLPLDDVAHTLRQGRTPLEYRRAVVAGDPAEASARLRAAGTAPGVRRAEGRPRVAFMLPGVGDQYRGLGHDLYRAEPVFAEAIDRCLDIAERRCGVDLRPLLLTAPDLRDGGDLAALLGRTGDRPAGEDPLDRAGVAHPFLFTVEYALAQLLAHRGITPDLLVGYSLGEYVAACLAGVFSLEDALWVVTERARLIESAPAGRMLAVAAGTDLVADVLARVGARADVAAVNGPTMTVISAAPDAIEKVAGLLADEGVPARPLRSAHAFHSSLLRPVRDRLAEVVASVPRHAPERTVISNTTGAPLTAEQATDPQYWAEHLCRPVLFADAVRACVEQGADVFVELGAGQTLGGLVRQNVIGGTQPVVLGTLPAQWPAGGSTDGVTAVLETCGRLWELGCDLDWSSLAHGRERIAELPSYPFGRTRLWPQAAGSRPDGVQRTAAAPEERCYAPSWQRDFGRTPAGAPAPDGPVVVFSDAHGIGSALSDLLEAAGTPVVEVVPGDGFRRDGSRRCVIDPAEPDHYRRVLDTVGGGPVHVVHLWSLRADAGTPVFAGDAELRGVAGDGFGTLLLAVQAAGAAASTSGVRLLTCSEGAAEITGGDAVAPAGTVVHGLGRVVRSEYPGLAWRGVDLAAGTEPRDAAWQLAEELRRGPWSDPDLTTEPTLVGWRGGRRWLERWAPVAPEPRVEGDTPWRPDGTYLITGGTRGLGMTLARHLVRTGVRRLALVGRTDLRRAAAAEPDGRAAQSLADVRELEAQGAEVLLLSADVGDPDLLRGALNACRDHFGALTGVVHAAGVPAGGMTQRRTVDDTARVLAPKVLAMGPLAELVGPGTPEDLRPELLVLYSSAITVFGGIGEGDYCAANTVLNAYGAALADAAPTTRVLTIAWGPWQHDDWQSTALGGALADRVAAYRTTYGFTDEDGCALLDRLVDGTRGTVLAVRQELTEGLREWAAGTDLSELLAPAPGASDAERFPRPALRIDYAAPRTELETVIADTWGAYLGIDRIGVHDPFFELGGNSLVGMAMVAALEKRFDRRIAPAVLFQHPTVAEFAAALAAPDMNGPADGGAGRAAGSARGERRRARGAKISGTRK